jgi:hypothetical protein
MLNRGGIYNCDVCDNSIVTISANNTSSLMTTNANNTSLITDYDYNGGFTITSINGIATGLTFENNFLASVPEPSHFIGSILSSIFLFYLIKKRKKICT